MLSFRWNDAVADVQYRHIAPGHCLPMNRRPRNRVRECQLRLFSPLDPRARARARGGTCLASRWIEGEIKKKKNVNTLASLGSRALNLSSGACWCRRFEPEVFAETNKAC